MYQYSGNVLDVHDGDTMHIEVRLGCDVAIRMTVRLYGINAPELATVEGKAALVYIKTLLPADGSIWIATIKDHKEKYGRYLGRLFLDRASMEQDATANCINDLMVAGGHAVPYLV